MRERKRRNAHKRRRHFEERNNIDLYKGNYYIIRDIRKERLKTDRGYTDEKISLIINSQMSQDEYIKKCDHVIDNSGNLSYTQSQLVKLL